ncbi:MAG: UpxY family transcription antiterminator [Bacteroidia bacterium]|nr:UpxY family transcription antiterminator [Bacteroidia bacterium]
MTGQKADSKEKWYVMRDLTRPNAKLPAYKRFVDGGFEVFTPMKEKLSVQGGKRVKEQVPFIHDLLFVHGAREDIDPVVRNVPTIQYRFVKGGGYLNPMTVRDSDMEKFIIAVKSSEDPKYLLPDEITPAICGKRIKIIGGQLDGFEGKMLSVRGSRKRHLLVELPDFLAVAVEVNPDYVKLL